METDYDLFNRLLRYDCETGLLYWKVKPHMKVKVGDIAGCKYNTGYIYLSYKLHRYMAHRLAWLLTYKKWPDADIDHINGIRDDNRICNLRDVTHRENQQNKECHRNGKVLGTRYSQSTNKWSSVISILGQHYYLGAFDSEKDAEEAYAHACDMYKQDNTWRPPQQHWANAKGCSYDKVAKKWLTQIRMGKDHRFLGYYNTMEEAHLMYLQAKQAQIALREAERKRKTTIIS